ncbi:hypothetical protein EPA93_06720 [Ktedonosporobacter rubrisoli]|uniref:Uncharacterized protein n=1 Tax=Ktedonosporobacter rubrisoli TaxID=2509675 RepID=A0A4P6JKM9_KTERU|nr:hypothetical protein [Ktedonosporobacter rubrisoli]QBD75714.1 hypothetical protein EPA93_06720 [Ktedonosporobacter rubrisoli]
MNSTPPELAWTPFSLFSIEEVQVASPQLLTEPHGCDLCQHCLFLQANFRARLSKQTNDHEMTRPARDEHCEHKQQGLTNSLIEEE